MTWLKSSDVDPNRHKAAESWPQQILCYFQSIPLSRWPN